MVTLLHPRQQLQQLQRNSDPRWARHRLAQTIKGGPKAALSPSTNSTILRPTMGADEGPPVQLNKASSTDERIPDLRAIVAATTLQSLARESLLASLARRQASA
jgi:hypothetical protein